MLFRSAVGGTIWKVHVLGAYYNYSTLYAGNFSQFRDITGAVYDTGCLVMVDAQGVFIRSYDFYVDYSVLNEDAGIFDIVEIGNGAIMCVGLWTSYTYGVTVYSQERNAMPIYIDEQLGDPPGKPISSSAFWYFNSTSGDRKSTRLNSSHT